MYNIINTLIGSDRMPKPKDLTNIRFGKLIALRIVGKNKHNRYLWECLCDCGNKTIVQSVALSSGNTKSCGCLHSEKLVERNITHNMSKDRLYQRWQAMKRRCYGKNIKRFKDYGGRRIKVCNEWLHSFESFQNWALSNGYKKNLTIERRDVNGNYCPDNCCWITKKSQARNTRKNIYLTINGETKLLIDFAKENNLSPQLLRQRYHKGVAGEDILNPPNDSKFKKGHPRYGGRKQSN